MAKFSIDHVAIRSIAAAVPLNRDRNMDYTWISEQERALLTKATGIRERRIAPIGLATSDLCFAAAEKIISTCQVNKDEIGLLVFVSQSSDYRLPATAALLQQRLGLPTGTIAFDVGLGCSGYVYGLAIVGSLMNSCHARKALLLTGDISSATTGREDKSTWPLFGDAGSATLLEYTPSSSPWHFNLMTDGRGADAIMIPDGGLRNRIAPSSFSVEAISEGIRRNRLNLVLDGPEIFAFSTKEVPLSVNSLLQASGQDLSQVDYFVMHQANRLMNETIRKKLQIPEGKTPYSLDEYGNTSSASIPLTMVTRLWDPLQKRPLNLLLSGFGVGLSWGNLLLTTKDVVCPPLLEIIPDDGELPGS